MTLSSLVVTLLAGFSAVVGVVVGGGAGFATHGESCCCEAVGEVDLGADGVCEVGDDEDVLDVVVAAREEGRLVWGRCKRKKRGRGGLVWGRCKRKKRNDVQVPFNVGRVDLWCEGKGVHEELAKSRRGLGLLVKDVVDVVGDALKHLQNLLDGALERLNVCLQHLGAVFSVLGGGDELETALLGVAVLDLVRHRDEQAAVGGTLGSDTNGGGDVGAGLNVLAGDGGDGQMDGGVGPGAVALLAVEVLDEGGEGVEVAAGGVPADEDLLGVGAQVQVQHLLLVVHVDLDLLLRLGVGHGIAVLDLDLGAIFRAGAEQSTDDALLVGGPPQRVVEDGKDGLGLDGDREGGGRGLGANSDGGERAGDVEERVFSHGG